MSVVANRGGLPLLSFHLVLDPTGVAKEMQVRRADGTVIGQIGAAACVVDLASFPGPPTLRFEVKRSHFTIEVEQ